MSETISGKAATGAGGADAHLEEARGRWRIYVTVFGMLFLLTVLELSVNDVIPGEGPQVAALVALMLAKASLVVLYYMHLRWESRVLRWLVIIPFFAAIFFVFIVIWV